MNIIRTIKEARRQAGLTQEMREKLKKIPDSRLNGIQALPVELWSQIIELVLNPYLQYRKRQCFSAAKILELRLVCHAFDEEIQRALHQRLTLSQMPYYSFLTYGIQRPPGLDCSLRDALLASALYRETQHCSGNDAVHFMAYRIKNCVLVAQHLSSNHNIRHEQQLYKTFCTAASTSRCCWCYIIVLQYGSNPFVYGVDDHGGSARECDILLEVSLLVATGHQLTDVKRWMVRLGRLGMLAGYREHAVRRPNKPVRSCSIDGPCGPSLHPSLSEEDIASLISQPYGPFRQHVEGDARTWRDELERELDEELEDIERQTLYGVRDLSH